MFGTTEALFRRDSEFPGGPIPPLSNIPTPLSSSKCAGAAGAHERS